MEAHSLSPQIRNPHKTCLTSVLGWKAAGLSCGENFGTMSGAAAAAPEEEEGEDVVDGDDDDVERAAGTANRLRTRSRNWLGWKWRDERLENKQKRTSAAANTDCLCMFKISEGGGFKARGGYTRGGLNVAHWGEKGGINFYT